MDIQIKGQPRRARYKNSKEVQQWLIELGYEWGLGGKDVLYLKSCWLFTNRDGFLSHSDDDEYTGNVKESFMPVGVEPAKVRGLKADVLIVDDLAQVVAEVHEPVQPPHPYQPIIDKLTEAKTEGWEKAVSWLGNVSLEKVKLMRAGMRGDITDLFHAFTWDDTPQRYKFWAKQRMGLI